MALRAEVGDSLAAIHFDVEPHANPGWEADPVPLILAFENFIDTLIARRGASDLPIVLDIPTWFDRTQEPRGEAATLSGWIQQRVDGVVLMAYISDVPTLVSAVETEIPAADALGRSLMVGVQLSCDASPDESLCSAGPGGVEAVDRALQANFRGSPSLRAIALHHYPDARLMWP